MNVNQCLIFYNSTTGKPNANVMYTLTNGFNMPSFLNESIWAYTPTNPCMGKPATSVHTTNEIGACMSYSVSKKISTPGGGSKMISGYKSKKITTSMFPISNANLNPQNATGMRIDAYYASSACGSTVCVCACVCVCVCVCVCCIN